MEPANRSEHSGQNAPPAQRPTLVVPDHDLIRCIGKGSYGDVWLARTLMGTHRAVKLIDRTRFHDERPYEREFAGIRRFEPLSRTHPGFVSILHVGRSRDESYFYYVMELADDLSGAFTPEKYQPKTLAALLAQGRLGLAECLQISLSLASALAYLHDHQLVHRDLKPANIIFVRNTAKLADIGLVGVADETATFVGTPGYIPPEGPGKPSADVFALGKVIYAMATGKSVDQFPELPTHLPSSPEAAAFMQLNDIVLRACQSDVRQRIPSSDELHQLLLDLFQKVDAAPSFSTRLPVAGGSFGKGVLLCSGGKLVSGMDQLMRDQLGAKGFQVTSEFHAELDLRWARRLERCCEEAACVVLVLTDETLASHATAYLAELAQQGSHRAVDPTRFVAVLFHLARPLPRFFRIALESATIVDWRDQTKAGAEQNFGQLFEAIG